MTFLGWIRVALLDLRGGFLRFGVFLACLALGVGAIAAVSSTGAALEESITGNAVPFLGGDLEAELAQRAATPEELDILRSFGTLSLVVELNARGRANEQSQFLNLRAVQNNYPLAGTVDVDPPDRATVPVPELLREQNGVFGAVVDSLLLDRLGIGLGDRLAIGAAAFEIRAILNALPDEAARGFQFGIPALISVEGLDATGLVQPGVLARHRYKLDLDTLSSEEAVAQVDARLSDQSWEFRTPEQAAQNLSRFFGVFSRFLTLVGLSSLLVGGVGVSNAVSAYLTDRQNVIATMRSLGATSARIMVHFLVQILVLAVLGILLGLVLALLVTLIALPILGNLLALDVQAGIHPPSLLIASGFGLLTAFLFGFLPLRRAQKLKPATLFRSAGAGGVERGLTWRELIHPTTAVPLLVAVAAVLALASLATGETWLVLWYAGAAVAAFIVLHLAAWALQRVLRLLPHLPNANLRNALKAIYRPGTPAPTVILSLGLGLALLLLIALIDDNLRGELGGEIAREVPTFGLVNMLTDEVAALEALEAEDVRVTDFTATPILRAVIAEVKGQPVADLPPLPRDIAFMFEGDTMFTWSRTVPEGSRITAGEWWPEDYVGEPLVSLSDELREPLGLSVGDTLTLNLLGRPIKARIASFRSFEENDPNFNFMMVMSPGMIESAPASFMGTLTAAEGEEDAVQRLLIDRFPELSFLPVSDILNRVAGVLGNLANAVAIVGGLAVVSGVFVLAGAMSAGRKQRQSDAVVMKVLGATRGDVVAAFLTEYGILGALAALIASALGAAGAWAILTQVLELQFTLDLGLIALVMLGSVAVTALVGIITTWSALSVRPARYLRSEG